MPDDLAAAVGPLKQVANELHEVAAHRSRLRALLEGSPDVELREAGARLLSRWEDAAYEAASDAVGLAAGIERAANVYRLLEQQIGSDFGGAR